MKITQIKLKFATSKTHEIIRITYERYRSVRFILQYHNYPFFALLFTCSNFHAAYIGWWSLHLSATVKIVCDDRCNIHFWKFNSVKLHRLRSRHSFIRSACSCGMRSRIIPLNVHRRSVNPAEKRGTLGSSRFFLAPVLPALHLPIFRASSTDVYVWLARGFHPDGLTSSITLIGFHSRR